MVPGLYKDDAIVENDVDDAMLLRNAPRPGVGWHPFQPLRLADATKGFRRSIIRTMRGDVLKRRASSFTTLAQSQIPMLIVWGKEDRTVPFALSDTMRAAFPRAEFHAIDDAAHLPHIEQAARVDSLLLRFLRAH